MRQGPDAERSAHGTARPADSYHPKPGAPRRLRLTAREGGVAHRHRWREQPPGAEDRADRRLVDDRGGARVEKSRAAARKPPNARRLGGRETKAAPAWGAFCSQPDGVGYASLCITEFDAVHFLRSPGSLLGRMPGIEGASSRWCDGSFCWASQQALAFPCSLRCLSSPGFWVRRLLRQRGRIGTASAC